MRHFLIIAALFLGLAVAGATFLFEMPTVIAVSADLGLSDLESQGTGLSTATPAQFTASVIRWVLGIIGVVLLVLIIYGGVLYATSAGNEKRVEDGKQVLLYAIIGLVIIFTAFIVSEFVISALSGGSAGGFQSSRNSISRGTSVQQIDTEIRDFTNQPDAPTQQGSGNDCFVNDANQTCCRTSTGDYSCYNQTSRNTDKCYVDGQSQLCCPNIFGRFRCSQ